MLSYRYKILFICYEKIRVFKFKMKINIYVIREGMWFDF